MKCQIPQISWHSRDPVLSIDLQPCKDNKIRLASGGTDSHVLIWYITYLKNKSINIECASDLYRHNKSVNVVRFSPNGDLLASGDDEGALFIWQLKDRDGAEVPKDEDNINQEDWYPLKLLRGHLEDIYDISWSADNNFLVSASMDNTAIVWDLQKFQKAHIFSESKGYVQGVTWDPLNMYIATIGTDRTLRIHNINTKKNALRIKRAPWTVTTDKGTFPARLFYDDTLKSYFRRLCFTPDGELIIVPSGILEKDDKFANTTFIFSRHSPSKPVAHLPTGDKYTVAVRCSPRLYKLRCAGNKANQNVKSMINLPYRMVFAVAACDSVVIYDTEQLVPIAYVSNIHYTHLTDLTWSTDGQMLIASSTDGYCSFIVFSNEELGEEYIPPPPPESPKKEEKKQLLQPNQIILNSSKPEDIPEKSNVSKLCEKENEPLESTANLVPAAEAVSNPASPKEVKSPLVTKPKKPKLTIDSFFVSPKTRPASSIKREISSPSVPFEAAIADVDKKNIEDNSKLTAVLNKTAGCDTSDDGGIRVSSIKKKPVELDVNNDSCSIELICEVDKSKASTPLKNDPKCKTALSFTDKIKSSNNVDNSNLAQKETVVTFDESSSVLPERHPNDDWTLELSQDEEIMPMDTSEPSTSNAEVNSVTKESTPKPKRRINLITLSKTVTKTT